MNPSPQSENALGELRAVFDEVVGRTDRGPKHNQFLEGLLAPGLGFAFVLRRREYAGLIIRAVISQTVVSLAMIAVVGGIGYFAFDYLHSGVAWALEKISRGRVSSTAENASWWITLVLLACSLWYIFIVVWRVTGGLLNDYNGDRITKRVLEDLGLLHGDFDPSFLGAAGQVAKQVAKVHIAVLVTSPLSLIPVAGTILGGVLVGCYAMYLHGSAELQDPLLGFGVPRSEANSLCRKNISTIMGLGVSRASTDWIPALGGLSSACESVGRIILAYRIYTDWKVNSRT